eukprot:558064-Prymnesium_polylepis.1
MAFWDMVSLFALMYTSFVTPFEVAFVDPFGQSYDYIREDNFYGYTFNGGSVPEKIDFHSFLHVRRLIPDCRKSSHPVCPGLSRPPRLLLPCAQPCRRGTVFLGQKSCEHCPALPPNVVHHRRDLTGTAGDRDDRLHTRKGRVGPFVAAYHPRSPAYQARAAAAHSPCAQPLEVEDHPVVRDHARDRKPCADGSVCALGSMSHHARSLFPGSHQEPLRQHGLLLQRRWRALPGEFDLGDNADHWRWRCRCIPAASGTRARVRVAAVVHERAGVAAAQCTPRFTLPPAELALVTTSLPCDLGRHLLRLRLWGAWFFFPPSSGRSCSQISAMLSPTATQRWRHSISSSRQ